MHPKELDETALAFFEERHIGTLVTTRSDGRPHAVPVGFMYDPVEHVVRIIAPATTVKVANARRGGVGAVSFVDGGRWATFEGPVSVHDDPASIARTLEAYRNKYGPPHGVRHDYVSVEVDVERVVGRFSIPGRPA
jgi:PPOX class probable F420-dependent enzyme